MKLVHKPLTLLRFAIVLVGGYWLTSCEVYTDPPIRENGYGEASLLSQPGRNLSPQRQAPTEVPRNASRKALIQDLLADCQRQLIPFVNMMDNPRGRQALEQLCPDSTPDQRTAIHSALYLLADGEFLESHKGKGGLNYLATQLKIQAVKRCPSLLGKPCLLGVIDDAVNQLFTNPFGA